MKIANVMGALAGGISGAVFGLFVEQALVTKYMYNTIYKLYTDKARNEDTKLNPGKALGYALLCTLWFPVHMLIRTALSPLTGLVRGVLVGWDNPNFRNLFRKIFHPKTHCIDLIGCQPFHCDDPNDGPNVAVKGLVKLSLVALFFSLAFFALLATGVLFPIFIPLLPGIPLVALAAINTAIWMSLLTVLMGVQLLVSVRDTVKQPPVQVIHMRMEISTDPVQPRSFSETTNRSHPPPYTAPTSGPYSTTDTNPAVNAEEESVNSNPVNPV